MKAYSYKEVNGCADMVHYKNLLISNLEFWNEFELINPYWIMIRIMQEISFLYKIHLVFSHFSNYK